MPSEGNEHHSDKHSQENIRNALAPFQCRYMQAANSSATQRLSNGSEGQTEPSTNHLHPYLTSTLQMSFLISDDVKKM
ncbi:hypothetical protein EGR_03416 [Echinococcus granulosus]|uniref:Uncharacterized protein n=1 Tax=Echinococcus granulosus TaxID=6210 RepID=W6UTA7_ECHGR|nr:hypothetical protein EGR_03416 [Echinococcus granulosus]EUB61602.1 hypothetical protein EGR_03416 [Echinococcus granulosus]